MLTNNREKEETAISSPSWNEETKQTHCEHERLGETDAIYATSRTFSKTFSDICSAPRRLAHQRRGSTSALASSAGRLSGWPPVGSSRSRCGSGGDTTLATLLISRRSAPVCRRAGGPVVGRWSSHLCHAIELAGSRLLVYPTFWNTWRLRVEWHASTTDICRCWHHHRSPHQST